jgi:sugar phosphate isomerase/epimerase
MHDARIVGPACDERRNRACFDRVVEPPALAQSRIVVLGSGWTRSIPAGWTQAQAEADFLRTLDWCDDALKGAGVKLAIEPLDRNESNLVNSVADGIRIAKQLGRPEVRGLADFDYPTFFGHLKASGDKGLLSAECGVIGEPVAAMRSSAAFLRRAWDGAKG